MDGVIPISRSNRKEVEVFVKERLSVVSASDMQKYLFSLPWKALFTTNYDRLPESVGITMDNSRNIAIIADSTENGQIEISREDILYCFQLMGSINYSFPVGGWMILNSRDMTLASERRLSFFREFSSFAISGQIVYLGYSFKDEVVLNLLQELRYIRQEMPWKGFAVSPHPPPESILEALKTMDVEWVKGTLEEFVATSKAVFGEVPHSGATAVPEFTLHNIPLRLDRETLANIHRKYEVLTDAKMMPVPEASAKAFLKGSYNTFYPYVMNWDYPRNVRCSWSRKRDSKVSEMDFSKFHTRTDYARSSYNLAIALVGGAGSGKTIAVNRLAYNWYRTGNPVIFVDPKILVMDRLALEGLVDEIWKKYLDKSKEFGIADPPSIRFLIIADDCPNHLDELTRIRDRLMGIGKPVDIVLVARKSELSDEVLKRSQIDYVMEIDDTVSSKEWSSFERHFSKMGVLEDPEILTRNFSDEDINTSFFALLYTSVSGVRTSLKSQIKSEFLSLDPTSQRMYAFTSLMQSLLLDPWVVLTSRSSQVGPIEFESAMRGRLGGVVTYKSKDNLLKVSNRIIADIVTEIAFGSSQERFSAIRHIVQEANPEIYEEAFLLHDLLTRGSLFDLFAREFTSEMKVELYKIAIKHIPSRPLYIHLAREQMYANNFSQARISLDNAKKAHVRHFHEPDQHVYDAEGRLELRKAESAIETDKIEDANANLLIAIRHFEDAIIDPFTTPHSYQGLALSYFRLSEIATQQEEKWQYLLMAVEQLALTEYSIEEGTDFRLSQLRGEVFGRLTEMDLDEEKIRDIRDSLGQALGYGFLATLEMERGDYGKASHYAQLGRMLDRTNIWLMKIQMKILKKIAPGESQSKRDLLSDYVAVSERKFDIELSFEIAMQKFFDDEIDEGKRIFQRLRRLERRHRYFLTPLEENRWKIDGKPAKFQGIVTELPMGEFHYGWLSCEKLEMKIPLWKREIQYDDSKVGDKVNFEIIFNMEGPLASNVRFFRH